MSEMALPPALAGLLGGGAGPEAAPMAPDPALAPPDAGGDTMSILREMIDLAKTYIDADADEADKLTMTEVLNKLQRYLADEQKEKDDAMAGKASPRLLRQTYGA